jgi:hypothetical protein
MILLLHLQKVDWALTCSGINEENKDKLIAAKYLIRNCLFFIYRILLNQELL